MVDKVEGIQQSDPVPLRRAKGCSPDEASDLASLRLADHVTFRAYFARLCADALFQQTRGLEAKKISDISLSPSKQSRRGLRLFLRTSARIGKILCYEGGRDCLRYLIHAYKSIRLRPSCELSSVYEITRAMCQRGKT
jgi:hypothetical protein